MKQTFYVLLILGLIYFVYWYSNRPPEIVSVHGTLRLLEESNRTTAYGGSIYSASIHGTAKNIGNFNAREIWIYYNIGKEKVSAYISELAPNQSLIFRTGMCQSNIKDPEIELVDVLYSR